MKTNRHTRKYYSAAFALLITGSLAASPAVQAGGFAIVTNGDDTSQGSLRHALEVQEANYIYISPQVTTIEILSTLNYDKTRALTIVGSGQTIKAAGNFTLLALTEGADLTASKLNFKGPGNFSITQRGDIGQPAGKGIFIDVRDNQKGVVNLTLRNVKVSDVANHGIHISDCSLADDCGAGSGGGGNGSPASVSVKLNHVYIDNVGNGKFDADGLRVDDRGKGSIFFHANRLYATRVGADGVELDEGDEGSIFANISHSDFSNNGNYCDAAVIGDNLPNPDEAEFELSEQVTEDMIPGPVTGSEDDSCFEREVDFYEPDPVTGVEYVEEYAFGIDFDDGIDFDEAGDGSLIATFNHSTISGNKDEGVDFDEEGTGSVWVRYANTDAFDNSDDGFKVSEEDEGGVTGLVRGVTSADNGGKGIVFEEENAGNLFVAVFNTETSNNDDSDDTGIEVVQEGEGSGKLLVRQSSINDGIDTDGVDEI